MLALVCCLAPGADAQEDATGAKDHHTIPRFPGTVIATATEHDFGAHEFKLQDTAKNVEGRIWEITYVAKEGARVPSPLALARNDGNVFKKDGGTGRLEDVNSGGGTVTMKMPSGSVETWMEISINHSGEQFTFNIVTTTPMEQKVDMSADEIGRDGGDQAYRRLWNPVRCQQGVEREARAKRAGRAESRRHRWGAPQRRRLGQREAGCGQCR